MGASFGYGFAYNRLRRRFDPTGGELHRVLRDATASAVKLSR